MRIYAAQGFTSFVLCAGHRKELLYDYFDGRFRDWRVDIVDTGEDSDTGERIRLCADYLGDTFFCNVRRWPRQSRYVRIADCWTSMSGTVR